MKSKKILININGTPLGHEFILEKIRTAVGISAGYKEHEVDILLAGDSVYFPLMPIEQGHLGKITRASQFNGLEFYVDLESLKERNVDPGKIKEPLKILGRDEILALCKNSDVVLSI
jgi:sulfur relay (sulfurtransferase) DsrF/TusC family protein